MTTTITKQKKKKKKLTPVTKLIGVLLLFVSAGLVYSVVKEILTTVRLQQQLAEVQVKLQEVQDENDYLNSEKEKLQDPDYVETYARGKYQLSKDGEQIFYLPEKKDK